MAVFILYDSLPSSLMANLVTCFQCLNFNVSSSFVLYDSFITPLVYYLRATPLYEQKFGLLLQINKKRDLIDFKLQINNNFDKTVDSTIFNKIIGITSQLNFNRRGFISGRSTSTNLFCLTQWVSDQLDDRDQVSIALTDVSNTFNVLKFLRRICYNLIYTYSSFFIFTLYFPFLFYCFYHYLMVLLET